MKNPTDVPVKIVQLGAGGTGGHVAPQIYRLLYSLNRPTRYIICDGDVVKEKNLLRQNFSPADRGENKAMVLAEQYSTVFGLESEYVLSFIEKLDTLLELIQPSAWKLEERSHKQTVEMVIFLGAVDNNKSRKLCHQAFYQMKDLVYIDSGNGEFSGQVVCGVRRNGHTVFKPIGGVQPEPLKDTDKFPSELSCAETSVSDPQSMAANITAATAVVNIVYNILALGESLVRQT